MGFHRISIVFLCVQLSHGSRLSQVEFESSGHLKHEAGLDALEGVCANPTPLAVSQTVKGSGIVKITTKAQTPQGPFEQMISQNIDITQSFDVHTLNGVVEATAGQVGPDGQQLVDSTANFIVNWDKLEVAFRQKTSFKGHIIQNKCYHVMLPKFLSKLPRGVVLKAMKSLNSLRTCSDHVDGVDFYEENFPPKVLPAQFAAKIPFTLHQVEGMDSQGIMKSLVYDSTQKGPKEVTVHEKLDFTEGSLGGPGADDLQIPAEWGTCETPKVFPTMADLEMFWQKKTVPIAGFLRQLVDAAKMMEPDQFGADGKPSPTLEEVYGATKRVLKGLSDLFGPNHGPPPSH